MADTMKFLNGFDSHLDYKNSNGFYKKNSLFDYQSNTSLQIIIGLNPSQNIRRGTK